jgi:hypothetical protein
VCVCVCVCARARARVYDFNETILIFTVYNKDPTLPEQYLLQITL